MNYYYMDAAGQVAGPVPKEGLIELLKSKQITKETQICPEGAQEWIPITDVVKSKKKKRPMRTGTSTSLTGTSVDLDTDTDDDEEEESASPKKIEKPTRTSSKPSSSAATPSALPGQPQDVVVLNLNVGFGRMILLGIKLAFAAVPGLIILCAIMAGIFMGLLQAFPQMKQKCPFGFGHEAAAPAPKAKEKGKKAAAEDKNELPLPPPPDAMDGGGTSTDPSGSSDDTGGGTDEPPTGGSDAPPTGGTDVPPPPAPPTGVDTPPDVPPMSE